MMCHLIYWFSSPTIRIDQPCCCARIGKIRFLFWSRKMTALGDLPANSVSLLSLQIGKLAYSNWLNSALRWRLPILLAVPSPQVFYRCLTLVEQSRLPMPHSSAQCNLSHPTVAHSPLAELIYRSTRQLILTV